MARRTDGTAREAEAGDPEEGRPHAAIGKAQDIAEPGEIAEIKLVKQQDIEMHPAGLRVPHEQRVADIGG